MSAAAWFPGPGGVLLSRRGHLARLHLIEPPPGSKRAIDARRDESRVRAWFQAKLLGMTSTQIVASRTAAEARTARRAES